MKPIDPMALFRLSVLGPLASRDKLGFCRKLWIWQVGFTVLIIDWHWYESY